VCSIASIAPSRHGLPRRVRLPIILLLLILCTHPPDPLHRLSHCHPPFPSRYQLWRRLVHDFQSWEEAPKSQAAAPNPVNISSLRGPLAGPWMSAVDNFGVSFDNHPHSHPPPSPATHPHSYPPHPTHTPTIPHTHSPRITHPPTHSPTRSSTRQSRGRAHCSH